MFISIGGGNPFGPNSELSVKSVTVSDFIWHNNATGEGFYSEAVHSATPGVARAGLVANSGTVFYLMNGAGRFVYAMDYASGKTWYGNTATFGAIAFGSSDLTFAGTSEFDNYISGAASTRAAVRADGGDAADTGTVYASSAGKLYFKVANTTADTDWERVTTTAAD